MTVDPRDHGTGAVTALLGAAAQHLAQGEALQAVHAASEACHLAPDWPQAHYAYGEAWLAADDPRRAEQAFAATLKLLPTSPEAWVNYGIARYRQGALGDAKTAMRQALRHAPGHKAASANLGAFLRITGETEAAEEVLRSALAQDPDNAGARLNAAADLLQEGRPGEALALLQAGVAPAGDGQAARHWRLQAALALVQLGRAEEARAELSAFEALGPVPRAIAPLWRWRRVLLALAEADPALARREAEQMEAALDAMGPDAVPEHGIMGHYDLAKFWSGQNEAARAFAHWKAGHALLARSQPFSREAHAALIEATIGQFGAARFAGARAVNADPAPVLIVGMPRSGTTLCEQIIAAHRDAHGAGERDALGRMAAELAGGVDPATAPARLASLDAAALDRAASRYLEALHALAPDKARVVDKLPGNYLQLGLVGLMLPGARIIHCTRDPRDIGLSIYTFRFYGSHGYAHDLGDLGWTIAQQHRLMEHWKAVLPNPILTVRLQDWVQDFAGTLGRVLDHLGLPPDPACAQFHQSERRVRTVSRAQVREPVNARGLGRWLPYATLLEPMIAELRQAGLVPGEAAQPGGRT